MDPPDWNKFVTIKLENNEVVVGEKPLDYYGPLKEKYESHNSDYMEDHRS
jgi:hypothetical protein